MAAAAAQQQAIAAALQGHDRLCHSTEMPLFFGRKDKDTITAWLFIDRIETAARVANWDDARKLSEIYLVLRDRAVIWWNSLEDAGIDRDNWNAVKNEFLASYQPRYTAKITYANFTELTQRQGEGFHDYYLRVHDVYFKMCEAKLADIATLRVVPANIATLAVPVAPANLAECKPEGIRDAEKVFKHQLFLAGLNEPIRGRVMEANKESLHEAMRLAVKLETIHQASKWGQVAAIYEEDDSAAADYKADDNFGDYEIVAINAIRQRQGKPLFRRNFRCSFGKTNLLNGKTDITCRYCKKKGHMQRECRKRIAENSAMTNAEGKPFTKKVKAAAVEDNARVNNKPRSSTVGSIVSGALNALNWWTVWMTLPIQTVLHCLIALTIWMIYFVMSCLMPPKK